MGLLDRWTKKKQAQQLQTAEKAAVQEVKKAKVKTGVKQPVAASITKTSAPVKVSKVSDVGYRILVRPLITEKAATQESSNKYTFMVMRSATKWQIKQAIREIYGMKPLDVRVLNVQGKRVRFGRTAGRRSDYKKAIVTLPAGQTINIHAGV